ncbi:MAG: hypothetical protein HYY81_05810 [Deltaproteobacteria bacterium]|nr:hypothetical protein [Deltaproteobacteria bacterium]
MAGIFGDPKLDLRIEYAKTSDIQFTHSRYTSGFTYRGLPLSHFIGTKGDDLYDRLTRWISPDLLLGLQVSRSHIGTTVPAHLGPRLTQSQSFGWDLSYRLSQNSSISLGYEFSLLRSENRNNTSDKGPTKDNNLFRFEFSRSFGQ